MGASESRRQKRLRDGTTKAEDAAAAAAKPKKTSAEQPTEPSKKNKKPKLHPEATAGDKSEESESKEEAEDADEAGGGEVEGEAEAAKKVRFIAFVGNLPYSATKESLESHFAALQPQSIRVATEKGNPSKCKGFAFIEFANFDRMKSCLEKFHHTEFNDGKSEPRKINIELTAGGGGQTAFRKQKLAEKNHKLMEQRQRKAEAAKVEKAEKVKNAPPKEEVNEDDRGSVHPSRRRRVKKNSNN